MNVQKSEALPPPPGVFGSLKAGFDVVSNHLALIFLPLGLDLLLWLGPRLSVNDLLGPLFKFVFNQARRGVAASDLDRFIANQNLAMEHLQDFNLLSLLSKYQLFPVGISSLAAQTLPVKNPFGLPSVVIISSAWVMLGLAFGLIVLGWIGGGIYFRLVSGTISGAKEASVSFSHAVVQTLLLCVVCVIVLLIILVPLSFLLVMAALINPLLANILVFTIMFFSFWLIVPLFFIPHGIFIRRQNALYSIYSGLRMTRFSLPTSGLFVLCAFLLSRGLDYLWSVPETDTWLALVGFAGHAFISTTLLAASFVYYRDMVNWLQAMVEKFQQVGQRPPFRI